MKKGNVCISAGLLMLIAALMLTGYNLWDTYRAGQAAGAALTELSAIMENEIAPRENISAKHPQDESATAVPVEIVYPDYVLHPEMEMPVKRIDGKDYIGIVSIPSMGRELPVFSEWDYASLKNSPCRYAGSVYQNNMVICAHNYRRHFGVLRYLKYGDEVIFTDMDGNVFNYRVKEIETLKPREIEEMKNADCDLTLFTCTVGGRTRITVRCERV